MNSKGWKLGLFAIAAVIGLSACGDKKKSKATSPYAGIWVNQENAFEYSRHRGHLSANDYRSFCPKVYENPRQWGDSELNVRAYLIHSNGEVYRYSAEETVNAPGFREMNFMGTVNPAGTYTAGNIGPDGRVISSAWGNQRFSSSDLPSRTTFWISARDRDVLNIVGSGMLQRQSAAVAREYVVHVSTCLSQLRKWRSANCGPRAKDYDPQVRDKRCGDDAQEVIVPGRRGRD
jgi:hypothetical protein